MVVADTFAVVNFATSLIARKSRLNRQYFQDFVEPAWDTFKRVHENYKNSFREYINMVAEETPIEEVIERIRADSLHSADLRSDLYRAAQNMPRSRRRQSAFAFAHALLDYFDVGNLLWQTEIAGRKIIVHDDYSPSTGDPPYSNVIRFQVITELSTLGDDVKTEERQRVLTEILSHLQQKYSMVANTYHHLRSELLR